MSGEILQGQSVTQKKKWWQFQFAWFSTILCFVLLNYVNGYVAELGREGKAIYYVFTCVIIGFFLAIFIKRVPWVELLAGWITYEILLYGTHNIIALILDYPLSLLGAFIFFPIRRYFKNKTDLLKEYCFKIITKKREKLVLMPFLISIYILLSILLFIMISYNREFSRLLSFILEPFLFISGLLLGYISKRVPIIILIASFMLIFLNWINVLYTTFYIQNNEIFKDLLLYLLFFLIEYLLGAIAGYKIYLKSRNIFECETLPNISIIFKGE